MPAVSKSQQRLMGMAYAYLRGELKNPSKEVKRLAKSMKKKDLKDFAGTKHKGLPVHKKKKKSKKKAELLTFLTKLGNHLDDLGLTDIADFADHLSNKLASGPYRNPSMPDQKEYNYDKDSIEELNQNEADDDLENLYTSLYHLGNRLDKLGYTTIADQVDILMEQAITNNFHQS